MSNVSEIIQRQKHSKIVSTYCIQREFFTLLEKKIENNSASEGAFYQSEWAKLTQVVLFYFFHFMCVAANASGLLYMSYLANNEHFLYHSNLSF